MRADGRRASWIPGRGKPPVADGVAWRAPEFAKIVAEKGSTLAPQKDGSIRAEGMRPETDVYVLTAALNERITAAVYKTAPYRNRGQADTPHASDSIFAQAGGARAELKLTRRGNGLRGYTGRIVVGVATT